MLNPDVQKALREGSPVVALESTIISHGMPFPQNLETAEAVEGVVRASGAIPATIAVIGGVPHVGLTADQLKYIASRYHHHNTAWNALCDSSKGGCMVLGWNQAQLMAL